MAITLTSIWGGPDSNAYLDETEAIAILNLHYLDFSAWEKADSDTCKRSIIIATSNIDSIDWFGARYYYNQSLEFPRTPVGEETTYGQRTEAGELNIPESDIFQEKLKERVQRATVAQALFLLQSKDCGAGQYEKHRMMQKLGVMSWSESFAGLSKSYSYNPSNTSQLSTETWELLRMYKAPVKVYRGDPGGFGYR